MACDLTVSYDENLMDNIFFKTLQTEFNELFLKAISEGCIICVPRADSLSRYLLSLEDFLMHILMPTDELPESHFRNLCGAQIKISNRIVNVDHAVGRQSSIHILFQETFYTKDGLKYEVLCVEHPFDGEINFSQNKSGILVIKTLRDCLDLLWTETGSHETIENIDKEISDFLKKNKIDTSSLQVIKNLVDSLYNKCLLILMKNSNVKKKQKSQSHTMNNLKIAVEAYMQHGIYKKIMKGISTCTAIEDAQLNKIVRNFSDLHFQDFHIKTELYNSIPKARLELSRINCYSTTLGKINCLRRTVVVLSDHQSDHSVLVADDLLPILAFLIIKTNLPNWNAQLRFLKLFQLSNHDECSFLLATLEAAIVYIQSGIFCQVNGEDNELKSKHEESLKNCEIQSLKQLSEKASIKERTIHQFFHQIALGNLDEVKKILEKPPTSPQDFSSLNLCHPLCTCEKCSSLIRKSENDVNLNVNVCDDQSLTALHIASMYGVPNVVEYLLGYGANPNAADCDGRTPVHYAALRGHQNALLLLTHNDAEINVLDNSSNTPLHLCANNGHESCVKALIYFSEYLGIKLKVNQQNVRGDTPLHNASKWGYIGIVKILLEYGANPTLLNKQKFSSIDLAHNVKVANLLKQNCSNVTNFLKIKAVNPVLDLCEQSTNNSTNQIYKGIQPNSTESIKQVEKLLHAIKNGDVSLVCFYLGIDVSEFEAPPKNPQMDSNNMSKCHPLCVCPKCGVPESNSKPNGIVQVKKKSLNINVCNSEGYTPLHIASKHGHLDLVKGLIKNGALLNAQTLNLLTPLMLACQNQKLKIVKELLESGCQIDMQDSRLNTALHYACYTGNSKLIEILVKHEPNINLKNIENKTVLKIAKEKMCLGIIQILKGGKPFDLDEL